MNHILVSNSTSAGAGYTIRLHLENSNLTCALLKESACQQVYTLTRLMECSVPSSWVCPNHFWLQICPLLCVQTEENTVMKEALGRMKNSKEKNMCWQDGRLFDDKEDWVVDSCTKCTCQVVPSHVEMCTDLLWLSMTLTYIF